MTKQSAGERDRKRIAIVGGNFAGLSAALELGPDLDVTVFDPKPAFEWLPNIHELLSGVKKGATLRLPLAELVRAAGHRFVRARVAAIDADAGQLELESGRSVRFDYCIVAVGGINETFGIAGAARHAMPFKSVDECLQIYRRLKTLASKSEPLPVVIVGGGLEGIEALGEILRRYRNHPAMQVHLVEANTRLLPEGPPEIDAAIRRHVQGMPVSLHTGERVARVAPHSVLLASGRRLRSAATIWTGGSRPPALLFESGLAESPRRWASVQSNLVSLAFDNVLVAGDAAELPSPLPKQAYHAIDMGRCAAHNVMRLLEDRSPQAFRPAPKPMLLAFGDIDTYLIIGSRVIASPLLSAAKEAVFQATMAGLDSPRSRRAIDRLKKRGGQGLARLLPAGEGTWADLARMFSLQIDGFGS